MNKEKYSFSPHVLQEAHDEAREIGVKGSLNVHHIIPKWFAKKYCLDEIVIASTDNAIALEAHTFHPWIHGKRFGKADEEANWIGFEEADYIFLAVNLYGFNPDIFNKRR